MIVDEPPPKRPLTQPEHPRLALAATRSRLRLVFMAFLALVGCGALFFLKSQSHREQAEIAQEKIEAAAARAEAERQLRQEIIARYKGASTHQEQLALVGRVGHAIAKKSDAKNHSTALRFYLLAEENRLDLVALTNGDIFVTTALINRMQTEGQLAAVLAHGVAHVLAGDTLEPLATTPVQWHHPVTQEAAADRLAIKLMGQAGYNPSAMISMFTVLADGYRAGAEVGFFTTHPNTEDRLTRIQADIAALYPDGVPSILSK